LAPLFASLVSSTRPAPPASSTLSLHDALPIWASELIPVLRPVAAIAVGSNQAHSMNTLTVSSELPVSSPPMIPARPSTCASSARSEEHTSELQSRENLVCRLLLEKKKKKKVTC